MPAGMWISGCQSDGPASRKSTRRVPLALSRSASTQPAEPAPTMIVSYVNRLPLTGPSYGHASLCRTYAGNAGAPLPTCRSERRPCVDPIGGGVLLRDDVVLHHPARA